jgi:hypothetical protein
MPLTLSVGPNLGSFLEGAGGKNLPAITQAVFYTIPQKK